MDLKEARDALIKLIQAESWKAEIDRLRNKQALCKQSNLISLKPYLDESGLLCVGGRLEYSHLPEEAKHPLLIPAAHYFTKLVILDRHRRLFHAGANTNMASIREEF